ncbi:MAG: zinc protease [Chlamydiales bacterium]|jgi:zinc protease
MKIQVSTLSLISTTLLACSTPVPAAHSPASGSSGAQAGAFPYEVHRERLDNGLEVVVVPMPSDGLVSYWSIVRTGSRDEVEEGVTGFAHFFEHCMFRGTETLPGAEYDRVVNGMGADANAYTTDDYTAYHLSFAKEDLPTVVRIEADRFQNLEYDEPAFKTESGAVYGEYRKGRTSPFQVIFEATQNAAFDVHTYKHTTIGFEADVAAMPEKYEYSKGFFQRFYRPENVVLVIAGDITTKNAMQLVREHYTGWEPGYQTPNVPTEPEQTAQRRIVVPFDGQTRPILTINFKGERLLPDDRTMMAGSLLADLVFGETSALYGKLVLEEQRVEFLAASFSHSRDPGLWSVFTRIKDPADVDAVEADIWSAIDAFRATPVSAARLDDVRSSLKYGFLSGLSTPNQVCENVAQIVAITGGLTAVDRMYATLDAVTPEDVRAAADRWLRTERSTVAVLHASDAPLPEQNAPVMADAADGSRAPQSEPVLLPVQADPNVAFAVWFQVGTQNDPAGKEGLAQLTGSLLSNGGTQRLAYDQILERMFPLAASYGVSVDKEMTVMRGSVHRDKLAEFQALFLDALLRPGFRAEDFERIKDQAISSVEKGLRYSSDEELGKAALYGAVFAGTPYGHNDGGAVGALRSITLDEVEAFWRTHYTAANAVIALGGSYPDGLPAQLGSELAALPQGQPAPVPAPQAAAIEGRHVLLVEKPGPSTAISFGYPIDVHRGSREYYALWIANSWLGEHRNSSSHLYNVIREKRGMNYGDYSYIEAFPSGGFLTKPPTNVGRRQHLFEVWIRPVPEERALFALRAGLREVQHLAENGLTREQFEFTRKFLRNYCLHFAETTSQRLGYAIDDRFYGLERSHLATLREMTESITYEEVQAAITTHLQVDNLQIAMVTANAAALGEQITSDAPSPIDYGEIEMGADILAEDKQIEIYPLNVSAANLRIVPVEKMFE